MERISHWLAWATVAAMVVFAGLNWSVLSTPTPLNLLTMQVEAPAGLILLVMTAVLVVLFFAATLYSRIATLVEQRRLLKEIQQARDKAEHAEASRLDNLLHLMSNEFRMVNERMTQLQTACEQQIPLVKLPP